ncbi:hypothetical protein LX36DRAFT_108608 [Colletotrichum falcatum]|nr:hypothetical protein LX36DRAFT_108608 [Colletotrichum falcatum]
MNMAMTCCLRRTFRVVSAASSRSVHHLPESRVCFSAEPTSSTGRRPPLSSPSPISLPSYLGMLHASFSLLSLSLSLSLSGDCWLLCWEPLCCTSPVIFTGRRSPCVVGQVHVPSPIRSSTALLHTFRRCPATINRPSAHPFRPGRSSPTFRCGVPACFLAHAPSHTPRATRQLLFTTRRTKSGLIVAVLPQSDDARPLLLYRLPFNL